MDKVATLPNGDSIEIVLTNKQNEVLYIFKNEYGNKIGEYRYGTPATLSNQCNIAAQIKNSIDPNREYKPVNLNKKVSEVRELLQLIYENQVLELEQKRNSELEEQR